jgi:hypothetical protein
MGDTTVTELEKTIKSICKTIRKGGDCKSEKLNALAKITNAITAQEKQRWDPMEDGDPFLHERGQASIRSD